MPRRVVAEANGAALLQMRIHYVVGQMKGAQCNRYMQLAYVWTPPDTNSLSSAGRSPSCKQGQRIRVQATLAPTLHDLHVRYVWAESLVGQSPMLSRIVHFKTSALGASRATMQRM